MIELRRFTQEQYANLLAQQTDREKRQAMKMIAHAVMYGSRPDAMVALPLHLVEGLDPDRRPS